ncbi:hypothetical protein TNCT_355811 [Trichonephila clavata]|uniref:Uncharacterized protein n=1 Tax=Trichonephila clavata TaxID=2740835 RepID=A0A8X6F8J5_TRICU|nr:hypothetical protein TNCT_355811 [Trichonephila clavata]
MLTLMGIKIGPEAHGFAVKRDNIRIECSEIRTSDASKEIRTPCLEETTSKNTFLLSRGRPNIWSTSRRLKKCKYKVPWPSLRVT